MLRFVYLIVGIVSCVLIIMFVVKQSHAKNNLAIHEKTLTLQNLSGFNIHVLRNGEEIAVLKPHEVANVGKITMKLSPGDKITATNNDDKEIFRAYTIDESDNTIMFGGVHGSIEYSKTLVGITHDIDLIEIRNFSSSDYDVKYMDRRLGVAKSGEMKRFRNAGYGFHVGRSIEFVDASGSSIYIKLTNKNLTHMDIGIIYGTK